MNAARRQEIFSRFRAANPHPTTELEYSTPFELLIAVILSAQATDKGVNLATRKLFPVANTPEAIYALGETGLREFIKTIGLYQSKARHIIATCRMLIDLHHSEVPEDRAALEALPGVGRKTANVILNTAFGHAEMAVDTHIFRVSNRTGLAPGKTVLEVERKLNKVVPTEFKIDAHHWLILHGRYTCVARTPKCSQCLIVDLCEYKHKVLPGQALAKTTSPALRKHLSNQLSPQADKSLVKTRSGKRDQTYAQILPSPQPSQPSPQPSPRGRGSKR